jgi:hypothetical protein
VSGVRKYYTGKTLADERIISLPGSSLKIIAMQAQRTTTSLLINHVTTTICRHGFWASLGILRVVPLLSALVPTNKRYTSMPGTFWLGVDMDNILKRESDGRWHTI